MVKILDLPQKKVIQAIRHGQVTTSVVGLGHVGLPMAVLLATQGTKVVGCVRTKESAERINRGELNIIEYDVSVFLREGATELVDLCDACGVRIVKLGNETFCPYCGRKSSITDFGLRREDSISPVYKKLIESHEDLRSMLEKTLNTGLFSATTETTSAVKRSDVVLVTVGSPIDARKTPNLGDLKDVCHKIGKGLEKDTLVTLKSTVPPGTTEKLVRFILEEESKLKAGKDFGLAFMPETIYEGHALHNFRTLPKVVGGISHRCAQAAKNYFSIFPAPIYIYEKPSTVEAAKLFMNIYRDVNIALVNELALICERLGINALHAIEAANVEKKTHLLTPGLVGGYCLPKDTYHLSHLAEEKGYHPGLINLARQINDSMPNHILKLVGEVFEEMGKPIKGSQITVLGLGFKANSGGLRATPSKPIVEGLLDAKALVIAHDPFVQAPDLSRILPNIVLESSLKSAIKGSTCTVIVTDHFEYRDLTPKYLGELMSRPCAIVDARHIISPTEAFAAKVVFRGLGKPSRSF